MCLKRHNYFILLGVLFAFAAACTRVVPEPCDTLDETGVNTDHSCELAYRALLLEEELGFASSTKVWGVLDTLLSLEPAYPFHDSLSRDKKVALLAQFEQHLNGQRKQIAEYHNIMSICLEWSIYDCDINSILFYSWGERWNIPIDLHLFPKHMTVSLPHNPPVYWETTLNKSVPFAYYQNRYKIGDEKIYNQALSPQQIEAVLYFNVAKEYYDRDNYFRAAVLLEYVNEIFPDWELPCDLLNSEQVERAFRC